MMIWQTKTELKSLLCSLVRYPSITGSQAELDFPEYLYSILQEKNYYRKHSNYLQLHPLEDGRQLLSALVKQKNATETIILLSHFDVVSVEDYGSLKNLAFHPEELTSELLKSKNELPKSVQQDLDNGGEWLFGRGTMDMKAGLTLHLSMLERAMNGDMKGNVVLLSVPDEEVNSMGMITALPVLEELKKQENLRFIACLNSEPVFSKYPGDNNKYVYTGSLGKVLPGFLCYGKETHVGEPFSGLNANLMISYISQQLELSEAFIEKVGDEITPPPVSLMQRDLKDEYSVQTPASAVSMYNVLYLKQSINDINNKLLKVAKNASNQIKNHFIEKVRNYSAHNDQSADVNLEINVFLYEELYDMAVEKYGKHEVKRRQNLLISQRSVGDRDFSTLLVQDLATLCKELAPMIVLFYSPPFYPSVSSHQDSFIQGVVKDLQKYTKTITNIDLEEVEYFPGLSDLSYVGSLSSAGDLSPLLKNLPLEENGFYLPNGILEKITMPVLNLGPFGKDPHQWTERLEMNYSFDYLPNALHYTINRLFETN